jgi:hypothetical protein
MHPVAAALLRGLGGVAKRAVNRAAASVAEDVGELAQGIAERAHDVVVNARCACDCTKCRQARKYRQIHTHCADCGVTKNV